MKRYLWVSGTFSLTNKMLSNLRAAGSYRTVREPKGWRDLFAEETAAIRVAVAQVARVGCMQGVCDGLWNVHVGVFGHWRHDPDSWLLLGKAAVDGLIEGKVMASDRFGVWEVSGRTYRTADENLAAMISLPVDFVPREPGFLLTLTKVTP